MLARPRLALTCAHPLPGFTPTGYPAGVSYRWVSWNPGTHGYNNASEAAFLGKVLVHSFAGATNSDTTLLAPLAPGASVEAAPGLLTITFVSTNADSSARVRLTRECCLVGCSASSVFCVGDKTNPPTSLPLGSRH